MQLFHYLMGYSGACNVVELTEEDALDLPYNSSHCSTDECESMESQIVSYSAIVGIKSAIVSIK